MKKHVGLAVLATTLSLAFSSAIAANPPDPCPPGWGGPLCQDRAFCNPSPCVHGTCEEDYDGALCICDTGWTGPLCNQSGGGGGATHAGLTFVRLDLLPNSISRAGTDSTSNPYIGDTPASTSLPILCISVNGAPLPSGITTTFHAGWSKGHLGVTLPVAGSSLTSLTVANGYCSNYFGPGWRMAEFHDSWYGSGLTSQGGWSFYGFGTLPASTRFWVYVNDQPANPWN